jgi:prepilin-type N-terminal cleavage/methylation domain-containing protein
MCYFPWSKKICVQHPIFASAGETWELRYSSNWAGKEMRINKNPESGFSLIELSIVIMISGMLMSAYLQYYTTVQTKKHYDITKQRLQDIRTALTLYVATHGNLPCPAGPAGDYSADSCANEADPMPGVERYNIEPPHDPTDGKDDVWTGILPMKELRLDKEQIQDGWNNMFTYAVTRRLTFTNGMRGNPLPLGIISVVDENGNNMLDQPDTGRYIVVSHGPTGAGAWLPGGGRKPCDEGTLEGKNCSGLNVFVVAPVSKQQGANFYDDILIHDDSNAGGSLLELLATCNARESFYEPLNQYADQDGCISAHKKWH